MRCLLLLCWLPYTLYAQEKIFAWNVESGGNDPTYIAQRLEDLEGYNLLGLCEVDPDNEDVYTVAAGDGEGGSFTSVMGTTGGNDRLLIIYDEDVYELIESDELDNINIDGTVRAPFYARLKDKASGEEFIFMVNHLARGDRSTGRANRRYLQAQLLATWFAQQDLPVVAVGDFNFDLGIEDRDHDPAFDAMTYGNHIHWLYPEVFVRTHCNTSFDAAILDFAFVTRLVFQWSPKCRIVEHADDCDREAENSDHRAVEMELTF